MNELYKIRDGGRAVIAGLVAGDPDLERFADCAMLLQEAGADALLVSIPFSDPAAEPEELMQANLRALAGGATLPAVLDTLTSLRGRLGIPLLLRTYLNPAFVMGVDAFFAACNRAGVCGLLAVDVPLEEYGELLEAAKRHHVSLILQASPCSPEREAALARCFAGALLLQGEAELLPAFANRLSAAGSPPLIAEEQHAHLTNLPDRVGAVLMMTTVRGSSVQEMRRVMQGMSRPL